MKVLVTGGAGYIGSHTIIEILEKTDWQVISVDNFSNATPQTFDRIKNITGKKIKNYNIDLKNLARLKSELFDVNTDIDAIFHFAAFKLVDESIKKPLMYYDNNILSFINIMHCQNAYNIKYHVLSSSCSVYGETLELPVKETNSLGVVKSSYAYTKVVCERILQDFTKRSLASSISLRYFNPTGAHQSGMHGENIDGASENLIPYIIQTAKGVNDYLNIFGGDYDTKDGTCIRDYIHITDLANAHVQALKHLIKTSQPTFYEVINIGSGKGYSVLEIVNHFEQVNDIKINYKISDRRLGDVSKIYADISKASKMLDWKPNYSLKDMLGSSWEWSMFRG